MTNEVLKKKIVGILVESQNPVEYDDGDWGQTYFPTNEDVADALIAAGIGDVKETEHRAKFLERALHCLARSFAEAMCKDGDTHHLIEGFIKDAYRQAKGEFAEERKG